MPTGLGAWWAGMAHSHSPDRADPSRRFELGGVRRARPKGTAKRGEVSTSDRLAAWRIEPVALISELDAFMAEYDSEPTHTT